MKTLKFLSLAVMALIVVSCGKSKSSEKEVVVTPADVEVSGDMSGCFKVVDREYKVIDDVLTVEVERTDAPLPFELGDRELLSFNTHTSKKNVKVGFGIEFLDEDGNILDKKVASSGSYSSEEPIELAKLSSGSKGSIRFSLYSTVQGVVKFRVTSAFEESDGDFSSSSSSSDDDDDSSDSETSSDLGSSSETEETSTADNSSSEDWDAMLDSYEKFVDSYIKYAKKAKEGDISALAEYPALLQEAQEYSEKLSAVQSELTSSQLSRYMKITTKLTEAVY